ncbi:MAG TPA: ligase-associated DNA damage response DEXH box helicase [Verrucomicrobiae bacterium]|nr:ligase-associated DNA damage response DEXH box helicase [Verrucomicrobiae bacterium]
MNALWLDWFKQRKWRPFPFQTETWAAYLAGESGLVHAPTGLGKTYAVWGGPILQWLAENQEPGEWPKKPERLRVLWLTPLRALANDTANSLRAPIEDLNLPWTVDLRTGDTSAAARRKQVERFATALVTTPESLSLQLSRADTREKFSGLRCVVVDEWHEMLGTKRGVQTELCLARLRHWFPELRVWGLSATLGNLPQALQVLLGANFANQKARLVSAKVDKQFELKTLLPKSMDRFPWAGHIGLALLPDVIAQIERVGANCKLNDLRNESTTSPPLRGGEGARDVKFENGFSRKGTTLLFTNTRSQVEIWFQALLEARPDWAEQIALHHGSVDRKLREEVEDRLRAGTIKCVVCTSSLDLGVDFSPVEQIIQVGGPKGVARLLQRAGRSGHQPGATSKIYCVPANAFELCEFAAVRDAIGEGQMESREPLEAPLDVLSQHLVTLALGGGFKEAEMRAEIQTAFAYRNLHDQDWQWVLDFVTRGGQALRAYPQFQRVEVQDDFYTVTQPVIARFHRMSIGTITSDASLSVKYLRGKFLGTIEEWFISKLRPGDGFTFGGRQLEFVRVRDMTAYVRNSKKTARRIPQWLGGKMPLSSQLARAVRQKLAEAKRGEFNSPEMRAMQPILKIQSEWSLIPDPGELLIEWTKSRDGFHYFVYPFAGRLAHEGLAALAAHRLTKTEPRSFTLTMNDYGFALNTPTALALTEEDWKKILSPERLIEDLLDCLNSTELARRQFREIARIAGLIFQGYPGAPKSMRQVQASSSLFYEVFTKYDPENKLLGQARREVIERQLEVRRLQGALADAQGMKLILKPVERLTPLAFPLWAMWVQAQVSTEQWGDRVKRMVEQLEREADKT